MCVLEFRLNHIGQQFRKSHWVIAAAFALFVVFAGLAGTAHAAPGDVMTKSDGSMVVSVPGGGDVYLPEAAAHNINQIMRMDDDGEAETSLMRLMRAGDAGTIPALAIAAATQDPDRTALVAAAAIRADEKAGVKAANALRYVRGARKRQILLGAHASGNRSAYRKVRGAFGSNDPMMAGGGKGGHNRAIGNASDDLRDGNNPLGLGRGKRVLPLNRFQ